MKNDNAKSIIYSAVGIEPVGDSPRYPSNAPGIDSVYSAVPVVFRCVDLRSQAIVKMPFEILRGGDVVYSTTDADTKLPANLGWVSGLPGLLGLLESSLLLGGRAYAFKLRNGARQILSLRYLLADTITPKIAVDGVGGYERDANGRKIQLAVDDVLALFAPDAGVEIGPARTYPGAVALAGASVLYSADKFLSLYFQRGMVRATLLTYTDNMLPDERTRLKNWWNRALQGLQNAFSTEVIRGDITPQIIGDGLRDLDDDSITASKRTDIAVAFGVPLSKLLPDAANYATKIGDDRAFIEDTIAPRWAWLADELNAQLFVPLGYSIRPRPDLLPVMQEDKERQSVVFRELRTGGLGIAAALAIAGLTVPDDTPITDEPPLQTDDAEQKNIELARLRRWASKRAKPSAEQFASTILSANEIKAEINRVGRQRTEHELNQQLQSFFATQLLSVQNYYSTQEQSDE